MGLIVLQLVIVFVKELGDAVADGPPGFLAIGDEVVQAVLKEDVVRKRNLTEIPQLMERTQVNGRVSDPCPNGNDVIPGKEDPEGYVLNGEIRFWGYRQPGNPGRVICFDGHGLLLIDV
jgi:hypothetical protein